MITIIVPVYNAAATLSRCVDSILHQSFRDFELLLIDDGSTDRSTLMCDDFARQDSRVRVFHKPNGGVSSARNVGLDNARGEWITFVDSDDWIEESMYSEMYDRLILTHADIAYCDIRMVFKDHESVWKAAQYSPHRALFLNRFNLSWTSLWNMVINKELFSTYNIRCPQHIAFAEDYHVSVRLMYYAHKVCHVDKPFYNYNRTNETSVLHTLSPMNYDEECWVNLDIIRFFKEKGMYDECAKTLNWRLLRSIQEFVLDRKTYSKFLSTHPDCRKYIWSCPYINFKIKVMMWALSHHLRLVAETLLLVRVIRLKLSAITEALHKEK